MNIYFEGKVGAPRKNIDKSLLLLALLSLLASCGEFGAPSSPELASKVKRETVWLADNATRSKIRIVSLKEFDMNGYAISSVIYSEKDDSKESSVFTYNDTVSMEDKMYYSGDGTVTKQEKFEYVYDAAGRMKISRQIDKNGKICHTVQYDYDTFGNLIKKKETDYISGANTSMDITNRYSSGGYLSERIFNEGANVITRDSLSYTPDKSSVEVVNINSDGKIELISAYLYDRAGRIREKRESDADGKILKTYVYEYEYYK